MSNKRRRSTAQVKTLPPPFAGELPSAETILTHHIHEARNEALLGKTLPYGGKELRITRHFRFRYFEEGVEKGDGNVYAVRIAINVPAQGAIVFEFFGPLPAKADYFEVHSNPEDHFPMVSGQISEKMFELISTEKIWTKKTQHNGEGLLPPEECEDTVFSIKTALEFRPVREEDLTRCPHIRDRLLARELLGK